MDDWDPEKMFDLAVLDYMRKKGMHSTAETFTVEANLLDGPVLNPPQGFLKELWDSFVEIVYPRPPENAETREGSSSQMFEQDKLRLSVSDANSKRQHLEFEKLNPMLPSSSSPSHLQMQSARKSGQQVPMEDRHATNLERSTHIVPTSSEKPTGSPLSMFCSYLVSEDKLLCCQFSSEGKLLASAGHKVEVLILNLGTISDNTMEGHSDLITDIRFRANSTVFATSSFDRTVQIWDASKPSKSLFKLYGHTEAVMSLDFHPRMVDLLCSCDGTGEIRMWNIHTPQRVCTHILKGGSRQVRFEPQNGDLLAAAAGNVINLINVNTNTVQYKLEGHMKDVHCICWDISGKFIASISEESARIWPMTLGGKCIRELHSTGNKFESCTFHPSYTHILVIGSHQTLLVWNLNEQNKVWTYHAHNGVISSLAASNKTGIIASASIDRWIKLWR